MFRLISSVKVQGLERHIQKKSEIYLYINDLQTERNYVARGYFKVYEMALHPEDCFHRLESRYFLVRNFSKKIQISKKSKNYYC